MNPAILTDTAMAERVADHHAKGAAVRVGPVTALIDTPAPEGDWPIVRLTFDAIPFDEWKRLRREARKRRADAVLARGGAPDRRPPEVRPSEVVDWPYRHVLTMRYAAEACLDMA